MQRLLELDVVEQIYGSEAAAPAFFLAKPNGSLLLLVDFRELNRYLRRSPYYMPKIREILLRLGKAKCMPTLDANVGYFARRIQPQKKKVEAIQQIAEPRNKRELRRFLGMISYYRDMVPNKSTLTARLNRLTSKNCPFTCTPEDSAAFNSIKTALAQSVWLDFPDYSRRFHVFADASGHQIGRIIVQGKRIIACFSRSMTETQRKYSTMEWELLSVIEILKEYRTMLLGFPVVIHTNHKNLLYPRETSLRVKRWKLLLEEYRLELHYIAGSQNVGADAFSRLRYDFVKQASEEEPWAVEEEEVAIDGPVVKKHQLEDDTCKTIIQHLENKQADPDYTLRPALGVVLLHHHKKIVVPESLRQDLVEMYHSYLLHPGADKQYHTMSTFWWPGMEKDVTDFVKACRDCKRAKLHGVVHDRGPEFTGDEFQALLKSMAIKDKPIRAKNPQSNAICERVHLELMNILRVRPYLQDQLETALDYAAYAIRASYHTVLRASPAQLLFGEDMLTRQLHFANWNYLSKQRFMAILQDNERENLKRVQHFYRVGDNVMLRVPARERKKTDPVSMGPYVVKAVHDNGTVMLDTGAAEYLTNIRRIFPC
ncbi:unnamed protein product [Phytophthora fragariaefolia]|uniref:Unnamed protein product n=1 Tax=Phytophthora fragariaefolia TaxID=1490495 RepID=A0A9W7D491_9STRA|nr:unnamed protein product [Phytophthora fragariaefolia]